MSSALLMATHRRRRLGLQRQLTDVHSSATEAVITGSIATPTIISTPAITRPWVVVGQPAGRCVAIALVAAGIDARDVPPSRMAAQRRSRRLDETDSIDAVAAALAVQAEPDLPGV